MAAPANRGVLCLWLALASCGGEVGHPAADAGTDAAGVRTAGHDGGGVVATDGGEPRGDASIPPRPDGGLARGDGGAGAAGADGGARDAAVTVDADAGPATTADAVWSPLAVMAVVDPLDHGAAADGTTDDLPALQAAVAALPEAGGIVFLASGLTFRKTDLLVITRDHVKLWSEDRQATLRQDVQGTRRRQSILCRNNTGCGFFGLHLVSDAAERFDALEDNPISADHADLVEVVGCEVEGAAASGIFLYGSTEHYIHGNYVHHTWADHIHHTAGAHASWVWRNYVFNEAPSRGDDGVACVTYGPASPRCGDMEWWENTILHTDWGRGYSVIGGDDIAIHHNVAIGVAGAGIIVASEASYDSASSRGIEVRDNVVTGCGHTIGHAGILVSGLNPGAEPLSDLAFHDNVSVANDNGPYHAEGSYTDVVNEGLRTEADALPSPLPTLADVELEDTTVLRTRDASHVAAARRAGLHRIHVRRDPEGDAFQQRFEYAVRGAPADVDAFTAARRAAGDHVAEQRVVAGTGYALVLTGEPVDIGTALTGIPFRELRAAAAGDLAWLWSRIDAAAY